MSDKDVSKSLAACPSCGSKQSYLTRRCGTCGLQYTAAQMLGIAGGILEAGTSLRSIRRQISEAGRGIGREILEAASRLYRESVESTSIVALIASRDFGDPRIVSEKLLQSRYPYASQALRVEIAQTLLAAQTDEAEELIRKFKEIETDTIVKKAFDEPLVSSEGLSRDLESNLMGGKRWDAAEACRELEQAGKMQPAHGAGAEKTASPEVKREEAVAQAPSSVEAVDVVEDKPAPKAVREEEEFGAKEPQPQEPPAEAEDAVEIEAGEEERAEAAGDEDKVVYEPEAVMPPPLPVTAPEMPAAGASMPPAAAAKPEKKSEKKDYSVLVFAALGIVLLGAIIGYGVIKLGKSDAAKEDDALKSDTAVPEEKKQSKQEEEVEPSGKGGTKASTTEEGAKQPVSHILAAKVSASSFHSKYPPENVIDGDPATVWQEGKGRKPIGEWLKFDFEKEVTITRVGIVSGFDFIDEEGKDYYPLNCRLREAELIFSTGDTIKVNLNDTRAIQYISINPPRETLNLRITIYDIYKGSWFYDNAVGEIEVWGYEENGDQASE